MAKWVELSSDLRYGDDLYVVEDTLSDNTRIWRRTREGDVDLVEQTSKWRLQKFAPYLNTEVELGKKPDWINTAWLSPATYSPYPRENLVEPPRPRETEGSYINRCTFDDAVMERYPDEDKRAGYCQTQWQWSLDPSRQT